MTTQMFRCSPAAFSKADQLRSAAWMVGGSLTMVVASIGLQAAIGRNSLSEALLLGAFPAALMLSNEPTYLRPYSRAARLTLSIGGAAFILLVMWASVAFSDFI